ncbi:hypothetical protein LCGC14_0413550 [marine sediment metagenome]|uniref:Uncharacterized protein n=1 Tax=marine sediment metagenome TaxID=412755 RepID=A0A0F9W239_9ZZZZ
MSCSPNDNSINVPTNPGNPFPGLGIPFSPLQIPLPDIDLPTDLIEDFLDLLKQLGALFPSGLFKPNPDFGMSGILDFIANLLSQLAPFLSFYNFIMAALNLIICIIEVLCAIPNPFAVASKLKRLFSECLPPFLNLFPWLALIAMILALLLLILALIIYIIETIIAIIKEIIKNLIALVNVQTLNDVTAALAIVQKIASLLCLIENILAILLAIAAIMAVIQALMAFSGTSICADEDGEGCCPLEICPPFIKENFEIAVTNGEFVYHRRVGLNVTDIPGIPAELAEALSASIAPKREERWQLFDTDPDPELPIKLIITDSLPALSALSFFGPQIFYPEQSFDVDTPPTRSPYTVDMRMFIDPGVFHPTDTGGARFMRINDCIVVRKPYVGEITFNALTVFGITIPTFNDTTGTFNLEGGQVFEDDGETPFEVEGTVGSLTVMTQASLNDFIFAEPTTVTPSVDDGYRITDVEFVWKPNHPALAGHYLITVGCFPEVNLEKAALNAFITAEGTDAILDRLDDAPDGVLVPSIGILPNVIGAQQCVQTALDTLRTNITVETAAQFQATMETCLNDLKDQTTAVFCDAFISAVSQFKSTFSIDTDVQFTTRPIIIAVILRDAGGTNIATNIPEECLDGILDKLHVLATFGEAARFTYDRENIRFLSELTSNVSGGGELTIIFDGNIFSTFNESTDFDVPSSITEDMLTYTFVDAAAEPAKRRDVIDVAQDGS